MIRTQLTARLRLRETKKTYLFTLARNYSTKCDKRSWRWLLWIFKADKQYVFLLISSHHSSNQNFTRSASHFTGCPVFEHFVTRDNYQIKSFNRSLSSQTRTRWQVNEGREKKSIFRYKIPHSTLTQCYSQMIARSDTHCSNRPAVDGKWRFLACKKRLIDGNYTTADSDSPHPSLKWLIIDTARSLRLSVSHSTHHKLNRIESPLDFELAMQCVNFFSVCSARTVLLFLFHNFYYEFSSSVTSSKFLVISSMGLWTHHSTPFRFRCFFFLCFR